MYGTVAALPPSTDGKTFLIFTYIWHEDVAKILKVPGAPHIVNPGKDSLVARLHEDDSSYYFLTYVLFFDVVFM